MKSIGESAFSTCTGLTNVTISDGVTSIGNSAFWGCWGLSGVTIPNSVTSIGYGAFSSCTSLASVTFDGNAPTVGATAFANVASGCKAIVDPTKEGWPNEGELWNNLTIEYKPVPNGKVRYRTTIDGEWLEDAADISDGVFNGFATVDKTTAVEVVIPSKDSSGNDITSIGDSVFENCTLLEFVSIPSNITIGSKAFKGCSSLTAIVNPVPYYNPLDGENYCMIANAGS